MARTRTLTSLLTDVADRLDVPAFSASTFVSSTTMTRWLNQSNRRLGALVRDALGEDYGSASQSISVVAGTASYALPTDYIRTLEMFIYDGTVRTRVIERASDFDLGAAGSNGGFGYRILAGSVTFGPVPVDNCTVSHRYLPTLFAFDTGGTAIADLSTGTDYLDGVNGWEEWVVLDCCRKHKAAEEQDPSAFILEMREIEAEIKRDRARTAAPLKIRNVYSDCDWDP